MIKLLKILNHNRVRINNYLKLINNKDKNKKKINEMNNRFINKRNRKKSNIVISYQKIEIKQFINWKIAIYLSIKGKTVLNMIYLMG